ncbi:MAG: hypothetical protein Q8Q10_03160 [bacterium]|nr:hypothetical protein [bacterium]
MNNVARKIAAEEIAAHLTIVLDALVRIDKKSAPGITGREHTAFRYLQDLCNGRHRFTDFQSHFYGSVGLALFDTPYERKRQKLIQDIGAFLKTDQEARLRLAPVFVSVFSRIRAEVVVFGSAYKGTSLKNPSPLPRELATFTY